MSMHPFDQCLQLAHVSEDSFSGSAPRAYWNMVGPFGGMTAAILLAGVLNHPDHLGEPLVLTVNFCAPVKDSDYRLHVRCIRTNRSTQHWHVEMIQTEGSNAVCVAQATVVMGTRRDRWSLQAMNAPEARAPNDCRPRPGREGIAWFDRFDMRYVHNPMTEASPETPAMTWVRDTPPRELDFLSLCNRCDALFPAIFAHRQKIDPIATVSFNVYFHTSAEELANIGKAHTLGVSRSNVHHNGFADSEAWMWAGNQLIATTQQLMWYRTA